MAPNPRRICIFCPNTANSGEHIWPEWMHPIMGVDLTTSRVETKGVPFFKDDSKTTLGIAIRGRNRKGQPGRQRDRHFTLGAFAQTARQEA